MTPTTEPILKIALLVYNHAQYIEETLLSLLNQKTTYRFEIWVFEDCSTDNSAEILKKYAALYPDKIHLNLNEKNLGDHDNLRSNLKKLNSKYISILDGDDYWSCDTKIETMISFLETHQEFVGMAHNVRVIFEDGRPEEIMHKGDIDEIQISLEDLIRGKGYQHPSSLIYRNVFQGHFPESYNHQNSGDWFLSILFAEHGNIKYINKTWSVYRIHKGGFWSRLTEMQKAMLNVDSTFYYNQLLNFKYDNLFAHNFYSAASIIRRTPLKLHNIPIYFKYAILMCSYKNKYNPFSFMNKFFRKLFLFASAHVKVKLR